MFVKIIYFIVNQFRLLVQWMFNHTLAMIKTPFKSRKIRFSQSVYFCVGPLDGIMSDFC
jgi:hypothetical protein